MFLSKATIAMAALMGTAQVSAFFRMRCAQRLSLDMVDPIVQPGIVPSKHIHSIMGGNNFKPGCKGHDLSQSSCTSCEVEGDGSAYWVPALYFKKPSGEMKLLDQIMMTVYYLPERGQGEGNSGKKNVMFPKNFQMIAGEPTLRNFTIGIKDSEASRRQQGIGFNCLNYGRQDQEDFLERRKMPTKQEMKDCVSGLRAEIAFPACWNGKDADSHDHRSHVAYPLGVQGGACPKGFEHRLPSVLFETIWDVNKYNDQDGEFVWSNGDATGYGYHGDFMFGWREGLFEKVMADPSCNVLDANGGEVKNCNTLKPLLQSDEKMNKCTIKPFAKETMDNIKKFPGRNKITYGPAPADDENEGAEQGGDSGKGSGDKTTGQDYENGSGNKDSGDKEGSGTPPADNTHPADGIDLPDDGVMNVNIPGNQAPEHSPPAPPSPPAPAGNGNGNYGNHAPAPSKAASTCTAGEHVITVTEYETSTVYVDATPAADADAYGSYGKRRRHVHNRRHHKRGF